MFRLGWEALGQGGPCVQQLDQIPVLNQRVKVGESLA